MDICDRMKQDPRECQQVCKSILVILLNNNSKRLLLCIQMIEIISKNGDLNFHRYLATKKFAETFLKVLERKRGKGFKHKFFTKELKKRWDQIEETLLYLIQLWADTFMMKEDEFPGFQIVYRQLRKEKV